MHIALFVRDRLPVRKYGGTQRIAVYLARGLAAGGHRVTLIAGAGSAVPEAELVPLTPAQLRDAGLDLRPLIPGGVDLLLSYVPLATSPEVPWIRSLHGNRKPGTATAPNTLYLSRNHAERHGGSAFVYNGIDLDEFRFRREKAGYDLFLGRLHRVKGHRWAVEGARRTGHRLVLAGGWRPSLTRRVRYVGKVGGAHKAELLAGADCLWMPALWDEPFGLTLVEAMASGTPVLGTRRGALPEIVSAEVGALGDSVDELAALRARLGQVEPEACRARVERYFSHRVMAEGYLRMFRGFLASGELPAGRTIEERESS
jgi:glycosyltransferase involved in cell wall biosynthesis